MTDLVHELIEAEAEFARLTAWLRANYLPDPAPLAVPRALEAFQRRFETLREAAEERDATDAYTRTRDQESVPDEIVGRLLAGENPVRVWREHRNLSLRALAAKSGTTPSALSAIETGKSEGRPATLRRLAEALGVDLDDLIARA
jgi:ribosome-binding protein aMBF1 (putative translation factor)